MDIHPAALPREAPVTTDSGPACSLQPLLARLRQAMAAPDADTAPLCEAALQQLQEHAADEAPVTRIECLLVLAQIHHIATRVTQARVPAQLAAALAQAWGDATLQRKALTFLGVVEMEAGNLPAATEILSQALQVAVRLPDSAQAAPVWANLGLALQRWSLTAEALQCHQRALALSEHSVAFGVVYRSTLNNIASCALQADQPLAGLEAARRAIALNPDPQDATARLSRSLAEGNLARLLLRVGDIDTAARHADQAERFSDRLGSGRGRLLTTLTQGLVAVHQGQPQQGLPLLKQALEIARQQVPAEVRETLGACIEGYRQAGQPDVALLYLHEVMAMNRQARAEQVLQLHREHVARLEPRPAAQPPGRADAVSAEHAALRDGLEQREWLRSRVRLLEQQSVAAELHDDITGEHCFRVGRLAAILAREIGLEPQVCFLIDLAARLHDIGKLVVPHAILLKPGRLTAGEFAIMQAHTTAGAEILARSRVPQMHVAEEIARHHHERWDGSGYPAGLARERIPIAARVTALADVFDALTHVRPYKHAWSQAEALQEIRRLRGLQFDPELTDCFLALVPRLQHEVGNLDAHLAADAQHSSFVHARRRIAAALEGEEPVRSMFNPRR